MFTFMHDFLEGLIQQRMKEKRENERTVRMNIKDYERSVPSKNERQTRRRRSPSTRNQRLVSLSRQTWRRRRIRLFTYDSRRGFFSPCFCYCWTFCCSRRRLLLPLLFSCPLSSLQLSCHPCCISILCPWDRLFSLSQVQGRDMETHHLRGQKWSVFPSSSSPLILLKSEGEALRLKLSLFQFSRRTSITRRGAGEGIHSLYSSCNRTRV